MGGLFIHSDEDRNLTLKFECSRKDERQQGWIYFSAQWKFSPCVTSLRLGLSIPGGAWSRGADFSNRILMAS